MDDKVILITGGTGVFGQKLTEIILRHYKPKKLIIFSRDELKQYEMQRKFNHSSLRFFIGDVRDRERLYRAFDRVDLVIHTVGMKIASTSEYNPFEAVKTNIIGATHVIDASIDRGVKKLIAISSSNSVEAVALSGVTEQCAEKLFVAGNRYSGNYGTRFSVVRFGSVIGGKNSPVFSFFEMKKQGQIFLPDKRKTRFLVDLEKGILFTLNCLGTMFGGEIFIPKLPSVRDEDIVNIIAPETDVKISGIRPGESLHEVLISKIDARFTLEYDDHFEIMPIHTNKGAGIYQGPTQGVPCHVDFRYSSDNNEVWLSGEKLRKIVYAE